ncbi:MAG: molybdate ABC transporter substrate-binding protein [Syntrophomonadaceae bacterium]
MTTASVELNVSAAASLTDAAKEIADLYSQQHPDIKITYNFASSGTLQKQIEEGAPADLFISAGKKQMDALQEQGLIVDSSRKDLLGNELVLIAPEDSTLTGFEGLTAAPIDKIAIGTPETVPAGKVCPGGLNLYGIMGFYPASAGDGQGCPPGSDLCPNWQHRCRPGLSF